MEENKDLYAKLKWFVAVFSGECEKQLQQRGARIWKFAFKDISGTRRSYEEFSEDDLAKIRRTFCEAAAKIFQSLESQFCGENELNYTAFESVVREVVRRVFLQIESFERMGEKVSISPSAILSTVIRTKSLDLMVGKTGLIDRISKKKFARASDDASRTGYRLTLEGERVPRHFVEDINPKVPEYNYRLSPRKLDELLPKIVSELYGKPSKDVFQVQMELSEEILKLQMRQVDLLKENIRAMKEMESILEDLEQKPPYFNLFRPVPKFTGRKQLLKDIHDSLNRTNNPLIVAICGLGGVGKSEVALTYAFTHFANENSNALWIVAETQETLENSFRRIAMDLKIPVEEKVSNEKRNRCIEDIVRDVYASLISRNTLLIFDNTEDFESLERLMPWILLPLTSSPHILITSRNREWEDTDHVCFLSFELDQFTMEESVEFVKKTLGIPISDTTFDVDIRVLADKLGHFPLALSQAVAYIAANKTTTTGYFIADYIHDYGSDEKKPELFSHKHKYDRYTSTLYKTWEITFNAIKNLAETGERALQIINTIAYLAPDNIPVQQFFKKKNEDEEEFWIGPFLLDQYALIKLQDGEANIHRLVQEVMRLWHVDQSVQEDMVERALKIHSVYWYKNELHAAAIWDFAYKYESLFEIFFATIDHTTVLHTLTNCNHARGIERILLYLATRNVDVHMLKQRYFPSAIYQGCKDVLRLYKPNDTRLMLFAEIGAAMRNGSFKDLDVFIDNLEEDEKHLPNAKFQDVSALSFAARFGSFQVFQYLLEKGVVFLPNERDQYQDTMLHKAAALRGNFEMAKWLIQNGCDVNAKNRFGNAPLHNAVEYKQFEIIELLLDNGADVNSLDQNNKSPLAIACFKHYGDIAQLLIERGALTYIENARMSPLSSAVECYGREVEVSRIVQMLLENGADPNFISMGYPVIYKAAMYGYLGAVKSLLKHGADPNATNRKKETALFQAANRGYIDVVRVLLNAGANPSMLNSGGESALGEAARTGNVEVVRSLLACDIDQNVVTDRGETPLNQAIREGHTSVVKILVGNGANITIPDINRNTPLHQAARRGHLEIVEILLNAGAACNVFNNFTFTPLHFAAFALDNRPVLSKHMCKGHKEHGQFLMSTKTSCNFSQFGDHDKLHYITMGIVYCFAPEVPKAKLKYNNKEDIKRRAFEIIKLLLQHGAEINEYGRKNFTVLHYAAYKGHKDVAEVLLNQGADCNVTDELGRTPLHFAAARNDFDIVKLLVDHSAKLDALTRNGDTARKLAAKHSDKTVHNYLVMKMMKSIQINE